MGKRQQKQVKKMINSILSHAKLTISMSDSFTQLAKASQVVLPPCDYCKRKEDTKLCSGCQLTAYCSKEHQTLGWASHRAVCKAARRDRAKNAFKIEVDTNTPTGRTCKADRDIEQGEIILEESPVFHFSPPTLTTGSRLGQCVTCSAEVRPTNQNQNGGQHDDYSTGNALTRCPRCKWPCCSRTCAEAPIHAKHECRIFVLNSIKYPELDELGSRSGGKSLDAENDDDKDEAEELTKEESDRSISIAVNKLVARGFSVWVQERVTTWKKLCYALPAFHHRLSDNAGLDQLLSNEELADPKGGPINPCAIGAKYITYREQLEKSFPILPKPEDVRSQILHVMLSTRLDSEFLRSMTFEITPESQRNVTTKTLVGQKFIYEAALHFKDSCLPNCSWSIGPSPDFKIRVRAAMRLPKGTTLTLSRSSLPHFGTECRQNLIYQSPNFCMCLLCTDPTENKSFQSALTCPKCLKKATSLDSGSDCGAGLRGYFVPFSPEAGCTKIEKLCSALVQENFAKMVQGLPQLWACFKCGDICEPSKLLKGHPTLFSLISEFTAPIQTTLMMKMALTKMKKSVKEKSSLEKEDQLLDKLYPLNIKDVLHHAHYIIQQAVKDYKCAIVPDFPDFPKAANFPDSSDSSKIGQSESSMVSKAAVENAYILAIQRHAYLAQILDMTFPGLQEERIEIIEKLGKALLTQCRRYIEPAIFRLKKKAVNPNHFSKVSKFWLRTSHLCIRLLNECLLFYEGVWPSQKYNVNKRIASLRIKIEIARKLQEFYIDNFKNDKNCPNCPHHSLEVLTSVHLENLLQPLPNDKSSNAKDKDSVSKGEPPRLSHFINLELLEQKIKDTKTVEAFSNSMLSLNATKSIEGNSEGENPVGEKSSPEEKESTTKISKKVKKLKKSSKTTVNNEVSSVFNKNEASSSSGSAKETVSKDESYNSKSTKTVKIFEIRDLTEEEQDDNINATDPEHFQEDAKSESDSFEDEGSVISVPIEVCDLSKTGGSDDSGINSTSEENSACTNDENLATEETVGNEELAELLRNYMKESKQKQTFVKKLLSSNNSNEPALVVLKQLGFDQNLLQEYQQSDKDDQSTDIFEETYQNQLDSDERRQNPVQQNQADLDNSPKSDSLLSVIAKKFHVHQDFENVLTTVPNPREQTPTKVLNFVPNVVEESAKISNQVSSKQPKQFSTNPLHEFPKLGSEFDKETLNSVPTPLKETTQKTLTFVPKAPEQAITKQLKTIPKSQKISKISNPTKKTFKTEASAEKARTKTIVHQQEKAQKRHWDFFVSKLPVQTEPCHIISYFELQGMSEISVEKIPPKFKYQNQNQSQSQQGHEIYSSFHVQFKAPGHIQANDARYWPAGSVVRRWHNPQSRQQGQGQGQGQAENRKFSTSRDANPKVKQEVRREGHQSKLSANTETTIQSSCQLPNTRNDVPSLETSSNQQLCVVC